MYDFCWFLKFWAGLGLGTSKFQNGFNYFVYCTSYIKLLPILDTLASLKLEFYDTIPTHQVATQTSWHCTAIF